MSAYHERQAPRQILDNQQLLLDALLHLFNPGWDRADLNLKMATAIGRTTALVQMFDRESGK